MKESSAFDKSYNNVSENLKKKMKNPYKSIESGKQLKQPISKQPTAEPDDMEIEENDVSFSRIPSINGANWAQTQIRTNHAHKNMSSMNQPAPI